MPIYKHYEQSKTIFKLISKHYHEPPTLYKKIFKVHPDYKKWILPLKKIIIDDISLDINRKLMDTLNINGLDIYGNEHYDILSDIITQLNTNKYEKQIIKDTLIMKSLNL